MHPVHKNVLILSASAGAGHVRAAEALVHAFRTFGNGREVAHADVLSYANRPFRALYAKMHYNMANRAPHLLGWLYDKSDRPGRNNWARLAFNRINLHGCLSFIEEVNPDLVISTHFLPAELVTWLRAKGRVACRQAIVVTDYDAHSMWLVPDQEHYFVALEETREHMAGFGIARRRLTVSGIPIDPAFRRPVSKCQARLKLGLDVERPTLLVSAGGICCTAIGPIVTALRRMRHRVQVLVMCGRNRAMKCGVDAAIRSAEGSGSVTIESVGYTTRMSEYMAASDILIGKPGGLTMSEALASGLIFAIIDPIPGQEERNADHLLEQGVALRCNNISVLGYKLDALLDDHNRMIEMRENACRLSRPNAAETVVRTLLEQEGHG
ncbi:MAG TPA: glycosyltransferase [Candidatus Kapabacteria bacterium]|nr:glycosyltransferase [Candidatus Kapabacteria bacterium]